MLCILHGQSGRFLGGTQIYWNDFQLKFETLHMLIILIFGGLAGNFKMTERVCCGFARVFLWETKANAFKNITRASNEHTASLQSAF